MCLYSRPPTASNTPATSTMMAVIYLSPVSHVWLFDGSGPEVTFELETKMAGERNNPRAEL